MKDYLLDIVAHTHSLGIINLIKITGTEDETAINSLAEDKSVIVQARFKSAHPEFIGEFGLPNLDKLKTILNIPEYREDAQVTIATQSRNGVDVPAGVNFVNAAGDFKNNYRFMMSEVVNEQLKSVKFKGVKKWNVDFVPTNANIQRFTFQASANSGVTTFVAKTEDDNLKFYFGDASSHAGNFVFQSAVGGALTRNWSWPVAAVISILGLSGDKTFKISDEGAAMITVDSGLIEYEYIIPAQTK
jgi:hypothetical protein